MEYASAIKGGNSQFAEKFIEYLISPEVNSQMPFENLMYSVIRAKIYPKKMAIDLIQSSLPIQPIYPIQILVKTLKLGLNFGMKQ